MDELEEFIQNMIMENAVDLTDLIKESLLREIVALTYDIMKKDKDLSLEQLQSSVIKMMEI